MLASACPLTGRGAAGTGSVPEIPAAPASRSLILVGPGVLTAPRP